MAYLSKNGGIVLAPNHFPAPQPLPGAHGLMQSIANGQQNQNMATIMAQNNSGVQAMLKGKLKTLGIIEIVTGIISIIIGTVQVSRSANDYNSYVAFSLIVGTPWWTGVVFIIAGSLAVAVEKSPTDCMINGCLSMNIISAISCIPAIVMYPINLASEPYCYDSRYCYRYQIGAVVCLAILLVLALLSVAISIAISSFNCKAVTCCNTTPVPIVVVYNNPSAQPNPSLQFNGNPPPYNMSAVAKVYAG